MRTGVLPVVVASVLLAVVMFAGRAGARALDRPRQGQRGTG